MLPKPKDLNNPEEGLGDKNPEQSQPGTQNEGEKKEADETPITKEQFDALKKENERLEQQYKQIQSLDTKVAQENAELRRREIELTKKRQEEIDKETDLEHYMKKYPKEPWKGLQEWQKANLDKTKQEIQMQTYSQQSEEKIIKFRSNLVDKYKDEKKVNEILGKMGKVFGDVPGLEFNPDGSPRKDALEKAYKIVQSEEKSKTKEEIRKEIEQEEAQKKQHTIGETPPKGKETKSIEDAYGDMIVQAGRKKTKL